jgi:type I restriction enzyme S subunit
MNPERLLAHFETISEAPDAVARLRRFILDLAVRGKLVEQDPEDEPAEELLGRYLERRMDLALQGKIRRPNPPIPIRDEETPIPLPSGWTWVRLNEIGNLSGGMTPSMGRPDYWDGEITWLSPKDIKNDEAFESELRLSDVGLSESRLELYRPGCLFIVARSGILKRTLPVAINRVPAAANQDMKVLAPFVEGQERYLQIMLRGLTDFILAGLVKTGTTVQSLKYGEFSVQPFPIPPLAEQHRIAAKVDELMALCDQLEAARQQREQHRERLVAASLQRLNQPAEDPATARNDARFALQVLPSLTTTPSQLKQLRQTILNLAVRGKLVEQDPEDEPALSWLLQRAEGNYSRRARKTAAATAEGCQDSSISLLPETWLWVVLDDLILVMDSGWSPQCEDHPRSSIENWGVLKTTAVQSLFFEEKHHKELPSNLQPRPQHEAREGDILITRAGPKNRVGISCVIDKIEQRLMISDKIIRLRLADGLSPWFVALALNAGRSSDAVEDAKSGMAVMQMNISQAKLRAVPIPLPPLAEQHRIVAKVDELMALCDQLEQQLSQADQQRRRLLEAVLAESLA